MATKRVTAPRSDVSAPSATRDTAIATKSALQVNLSQLSAPPLSGFSDSYAVTVRDHFVDITFADVLTGRAVTRVSIMREQAAKAILATARQFLDDIEQWLGTRGVPIQHPQPRDALATDPIAFPVNITRMARVGHEAELELYYASISAVAGARQRDQQVSTPVLPIARVHMPLAMIAGVLRAIHASTVAGAASADRV